MKIGILGSSGGGAFATFYDLLADTFPDRHCFLAATDRPCGFETVCDDRKIERIRITEQDNDAVSNCAFEYFASRGDVDIVILYFLRLVTPVVYKRYPTFNIHPSLLPAFTGFNPVKRAFEAGVKFIGASLHQVDDTVDNGPLLAQMAMPISPSDTLARLEKYSYLHKVYLALLLVEMIENNTLCINDSKRAILMKGHPLNDRSCPALAGGPLLENFYLLQEREGAAVIR